MIGKLRDRLTYANVVGTIALFAALSGSAYAAFRVPPNSVGSRQLKAKAVTGGKIADATISGGKIEEETITGANIKMSALGTVPAAVSASNSAEAQKLNGHSASCPEHTTLIRGLCFDSHSNPVANSLEEAAEKCAAKGGWLPSPMELYAVKGVLNLGTGENASQHQYTSALFGEVANGSANQTVVTEGAGTLKIQETGQPSAYFCVYPLVR